MQGKEEDEGILSYVEDDDAAMCVSARRTFAVIFLECYKHISIFNARGGFPTASRARGQPTIWRLNCYEMQIGKYVAQNLIEAF